MKLKQNHKLLVIFKQALSKDAETGQLASSEQVCSAVVSTNSDGAPLRTHSEVELTISRVIGDSSFFSARTGEVRGKSDEDSLARSCKWS